MRRFLTWFPLLLGAGLGLIFVVVGGLLDDDLHLPFGKGWQWILFAVGGTMLPVAPWLVLSPLMAKRVRGRTQRALETLAGNAAHVATLRKTAT